MTQDKLLEEALLALRQIAGALLGVETQLECLCAHFGAKPPTSKPPAARKGKKGSI